MATLYKELLMDHYKNPRNYGTIQNADFSSGDYIPSCGDSIAFTGVIKNDVLVDLAFVGKGCVISQATASLLSEYVKGKKADDIQALTKQAVIDLIGIQLGPMRLRCALLPLKALQDGIKTYNYKREAL